MGALAWSHGGVRQASALLVMGVDGGGTKTEVVVADAAGNELGRGYAGTSNYQKVGFPAASSEITKAAEEALQSAQAQLAEIGVIVLGMSGVDRAEDAVLYSNWAQGHFINAVVTVVNDAELVLPAGTPEGWGIGVISGTGATIVGRNRMGAMARADGWGHLLGDEGSGYWIGNQGLRALFRAVDGRGPATTLRPAILDAWGITSHEPIMTRLYGNDAPPTAVAALAAVVDQCAEAGDAVAQSIIQGAGAAIAASVEAVVRRLDMKGAVPIGLAGGVIVKSKGVQRSMLAAAREKGIDLSPVSLVERPVVGAVRLAVGTPR